MGLKCRVACWLHVIGAVSMLGTGAAPAVAQTVGIRAGVSINPEQFYFGGHVQSPPLVDRVHFRPNLEIGLGNGTTLTAFNLEFAYLFRSPEAWSVYAGAGPALNLTHREGNTSAEPGANVLVGVAHEDGLFAEIKIGALDSPRVKVGIGYAVRWH